MILRVVVWLQDNGRLNRSSGNRDGLPLPSLLRGDGRQHQGAELRHELCAEKGLAATDQDARRRQLNISQLDRLDNVILGLGPTAEGDLQLVIEVEGPLIVEVGAQLQLVPDLSRKGDLDILLKEGGRLCRSQCADGGEVVVVPLPPSRDVHAPVDGDGDRGEANLLGEGDIDLGNVPKNFPKTVLLRFRCQR